jgi:hypothetical protein
MGLELGSIASIKIKNAIFTVMESSRFYVVVVESDIVSLASNVKG